MVASVICSLSLAEDRNGRAMAREEGEEKRREEKIREEQRKGRQSWGLYLRRQSRDPLRDVCTNKTKKLNCKRNYFFFFLFVWRERERVKGLVRT